MAWLSLQTFAFLYNAIVIPLRSSYPYQTKVEDRTIVKILFLSERVEFHSFLKGLKSIAGAILPQKYKLNRSSNPYAHFLELFFERKCMKNSRMSHSDSESHKFSLQQNLIYWLFLDYFFDLVYLADMLIWKPRKQFMKGGMPIVS